MAHKWCQQPEIVIKPNLDLAAAATAPVKRCGRSKVIIYSTVHRQYEIKIYVCISIFLFYFQFNFSSAMASSCVVVYSKYKQMAATSASSCLQDTAATLHWICPAGDQHKIVLLKTFLCLPYTKALLNRFIIIDNDDKQETRSAGWSQQDEDNVVFSFLFASVYTHNCVAVRRLKAKAIS